MLKNAGVIALVLGILFGWLKTHDHYVRADALAQSRRDSLLYADRVLKTQNDKLTQSQVVQQYQSDSIEKLQVSLREKKTVLVKVQGMDEFEVAHWKKKVLDSLHVDIVDSLVNKYDNLVLVLKAQVVVAESMERNEMKLRFISDSMRITEHMKYNAVENMNASLVKELGGVKKGPSLGKIITNYILPSVVITYGFTKIAESKSRHGS